MMSGKKLSILIPDAKDYSMVYVLNCFAQVDNVSIYVMTTKNMGLQYSRFIKNCSVYEATDDALIRMENINTEVLKYDIDILMPVHDEGVADLIAYQNHIVNQEKIILLPAPQAYRIVTDKGLLGLHLKKYGIPMPKTWVLKKEFFLKYREFNLEFPFIIKPSTNSQGGMGVVLVDTEEALYDYIRTYEDFDEFVVQEYFEGEDWGCSVLCLNGCIKAYGVQKSLIDKKNRFGAAIGTKLVHDTRPLDMIGKLIKTLDWTGVAHIDMRYNRDKKEFVVIEMNARYWGSIAASAVGGIRFPYLHAQMSLGNDFSIPSYYAIEYLKLKGVLHKIKENVWFLFNVKFLNSNTELGSLLRDPLLTAYRFVSYVRRNYLKRLI